MQLRGPGRPPSGVPQAAATPVPSGSARGPPPSATPSHAPANCNRLRPTGPRPRHLFLRARVPGPAPEPITNRPPCETPPQLRRGGGAGGEVTCGVLSAPGPWLSALRVGARPRILCAGICPKRLSGCRDAPTLRRSQGFYFRNSEHSGREEPLVHGAQIVSGSGGAGVQV